MTNIILQGDARYRMSAMEDNSVDAIITDPPYGLNFMGKKWDYDVPDVLLWKEAMRVLKPGGYLLSFAGTRTYHRMAVNIEDAGFEIRDMISWLYGSGFPKSLNIGKQVDKIQGNKRKVVGEKRTPDGKLWSERRPKGDITGYKGNGGDVKESSQNIKTKGNSEWEGWGTALKPACEPIVVARKPLSEKNVALNVLKWGTGGINIDACRVGTTGARFNGRKVDSDIYGKYGTSKPKEDYNMGRFPANIILDEEAGKLLDEQTGELSNSSRQNRLNNKVVTPPWKGFSEDEKTEWKPTGLEHDDKGGASRFFYVAKASKSERNLGCEGLEEIKGGSYQFKQDGSLDGKIPSHQNNHPTVKPIKLMEYLVKLVSKEGATVLDPFLGSGTTAIACLKQGRKFIGIEKEEEYIEIAEARINKVKEQTTLIQPIMLNNNKKEKNNGKK